MTDTVQYKFILKILIKLIFSKKTIYLFIVQYYCKSVRS